jgi:phage terminase Nu1 subunit (DNA packaging protein)
MGVILSRAGLAEHMGHSLPTIDRWRKDGMPVVTRGSKGVEWEFDLSECIKWYAQRQAEAAGGAVDDIKEIEKRTARAKMEQAELALAQAKGDVAPIKEFERAQAALMAVIRQNVMNVAQRAVKQLLGETNEATFKQKLRLELSNALEQSATAELTIQEDDDDNDNEE